MEKDPSAWFNRLEDLKTANNEALQSGQFKNGFVIARDAGKREPYYKQFRYFSTLNQAESFLLREHSTKISPENYYEYIGVCNSKQRPWFDLDIPNIDFDTYDPYTVVEELASVIVEQFRILYQKDVTIRIYETAYYDAVDVLGEASKFSFHLVVDGVYFPNFKDMAEFGRVVQKSMKFGGRFIDPIWTEIRQMRLLYSSKRGKNAPKLLYGFYNKEDGLKDYDGKESVIFRDSMITNVEGCSCLEIKS